MKKAFNKVKLKRLEKFIAVLSPQLNKNTRKLLGWVLEEINARQPLLVAEHNGDFCYCPSCCVTVSCDYIAYCDRCGQNLKWQSMKKMKYVSYDVIQERLTTLNQNVLL